MDDYGTSICGFMPFSWCKSTFRTYYEVSIATPSILFCNLWMIFTLLDLEHPYSYSPYCYTDLRICWVAANSLLPIVICNLHLINYDRSLLILSLYFFFFISSFYFNLIFRSISRYLASFTNDIDCPLISICNFFIGEVYVCQLLLINFISYIFSPDWYID